jgi:hypothetical protein
MIRAFADGLRRVLRAPAILAGVWLLTLLVSVPLTLALRGMIAQHLGSSLAAETAASGVNYDWWQEFTSQASGLGVTFKPTIIGFGAVLDNLSAFLDNDHRPIVIVGAASAYLVLWLFIAGGVIDRYARDRATRAYGFFSASGVYFFRFLRLGIVMWIVYGFLFGYMHPWLFERLYPRMIHDMTVERNAFIVRVVLYVVFGLVLAGCNLVFDYAKVRAVVEDRRSMINALAAAARFVGRNYAAVVWLYVADFLLFLLVVVGYGTVVRGVGVAEGRAMWTALALGQLYIVCRLAVKLVFWASEVSLFQARFAHAGYVNAPKPTWPDSPAAEAISRP